MKNSRRDFFKNSLVLGTSLALPTAVIGKDISSDNKLVDFIEEEKYRNTESLDLTPARWIWFPSGRCLPNTIIAFRKSINLSSKPISATGWILGESRYKLYCNDERIQFGPAPADPRWPEADPIDLTNKLVVGENIIGAEVLYYGFGDGTWPIGKPGFIFYLELVFSDQAKQVIVSDNSWKTSILKSWRPGQYKRWYLRAFQEEFDARLYPVGWMNSSYTVDASWKDAMLFDGAANKPVITSNYRDYLYDSQAKPDNAALRSRSITMPREPLIGVKQLTEVFQLRWNQSPEDYFAFLTPHAFEVIGKPAIAEQNKVWTCLPIAAGESMALTFEFPEQQVGFPYFTIDAPDGTVIELLVHEAHQPGTDVIINSHFHSWTRFTCRDGINTFETFDYESFRWLQLNVRNHTRPVTISNIGIRRRMFDWRHTPVAQCSDPAIQKTIDAAINTLYNGAVETIVDGMARERQQYSGDVGHVLHSVFMTMGEPTLAARFLNTYSQGITQAGYFLDCWPAFDRLARLMERETQLTEWGPLLDHGIGFNFDCYHYYLYTGEVEQIREVFPRLIKFYRYLVALIQPDGLLPVENIGVPTVWMDHHAYKQQKHKQCAFNLYAAAMMTHALSKLCQVFEEGMLADEIMKRGQELLRATQRKFWSEQDNLFINNLPWHSSEKEKRMCDRSLAMAILFDQCPNRNINSSVNVLKEVPSNMGLSYPANANWRYWALAKSGNDTFIKEMHEQWSKMESVNLNNTLAEDWNAKPDSNSQWSHCPIVPLFGMHMCVGRIQPLQPGFKEFEIAPIMGNLQSLNLHTHTPNGVMELKIETKKGKMTAQVKVPEGLQGVFIWKGSSRQLKAGFQSIAM